jgi:hypothetical protein
MVFPGPISHPVINSTYRRLDVRYPIAGSVCSSPTEKPRNGQNTGTYLPATKTPLGNMSGSFRLLSHGTGSQARCEEDPSRVTRAVTKYKKETPARQKYTAVETRRIQSIQNRTAMETAVSSCVNEHVIGKLILKCRLAPLSLFSADKFATFHLLSCRHTGIRCHSQLQCAISQVRFFLTAWI